MGFLFLLLWALPACGKADPEGLSWPRFRGPGGSGISEGSALPVSLGAAKWKVEVGPGHSSPILSQGRLFLTSFDENTLSMLCYDASSGRLLWERTLQRRPGGQQGGDNNPASPTPAADDIRVYFFFQDFGLIAFSHDGEEIWRLPLGPFNNFYGMASSPIVAGELVLLQADQDTDSYLLAAERENGKVRWKVQRPGIRSGYSTPISVPDQPASTGPSKDGWILTASSFELAGYRLEDGANLWSVAGLPWQIKALPVVAEGKIFINGARAWVPGLDRIPPFDEALANSDTGGDQLLSRDEVPPGWGRDMFSGIDADRDGRLDKAEWEFFRRALDSPGGLIAFERPAGSRQKPRRVWDFPRSVPDIASVLVYQGILYMIVDGGILLALDPGDGEIIHRVRLQEALGRYFASPIAGDGKIYLASAEGTVSVIEAGPELEVLSYQWLEEPIYATPALTTGRIYVRTTRHLYCFES